jgi:hypothetical protein
MINLFLEDSVITDAVESFSIEEVARGSALSAVCSSMEESGSGSSEIISSL